MATQANQPNQGPEVGSDRKFNFTDSTIRQAHLPASGQRVIWDEKQTGLSVLISAGGTKTFRATFGLNGKYYTDKIGRVGELPLGEARKRTANYRQLASDGIDPRRPKASPLTYGEVVDRFIEQVAKPTQRSWDQTERVLTRNCGAWLKKPIAEITKHDARTLVRSFIADGHLGKAAVTKSWIKTLWDWAASENLVTSAVMADFGIPIPKKSRNRVYSDAEIKAIWNAADRLDPIPGAYFKLLLLLAPRKSALAAMRHSDIKYMNFQRTRSKEAPKERVLTWETPWEHTKSRATSEQRTYTTPLPPLAQRIIAGLPGGHERVFPGIPPHPASHFAKQLRERGAPSDFRYHTVRHTVSTFLQDEGASEYERKLILNHAGSGVTAGYSHGQSLKLKLELLTEWSAHIEALVQPEGVTLLR